MVSEGSDLPSGGSLAMPQPSALSEEAPGRDPISERLLNSYGEPYSDGKSMLQGTTSETFP